MTEPDVENNLEQSLLDNTQTKSHLFSDIDTLIHIASGVFLASISWSVVKTTDSAVIGHIPNNSTEYLYAASLSDIFTGTISAFMFTPTLSVLASQSLGALREDNALGWLKISFLVDIPCIALALFLCFNFKYILLIFGLHGKDIELAKEFTWVISLCIPARVFIQDLTKYLTAKKLMTFQVSLVLTLCLLNLIFSYLFVLEFGYGFLASAAVSVSLEYLGLVSLLIYFTTVIFKRQEIEPFIKDSFFKHFEMQKIKTYLENFLPNAFSLLSDYARFVIIAAFAGSISNEALLVFNTSYRVLYLAMIITTSLGTSAVVILGNSIGAKDVERAYNSIKLNCLLYFGFILVFTAGVFFWIEDIGSLFSNDKEIINFFIGVRTELALLVFSMNSSMFLERFPIALRKSKEASMASFIGSWVVQVPFSFFVLNFVDRSLSSLFIVMSGGYLVISLKEAIENIDSEN
eukprot:snap_masked-scaffold_48-processed-gene-1.68-mRNA-1 protein AED:1.00 eAED:1.00 QI:0/0/0/0/1/1/2/0/461